MLLAPTRPATQRDIAKDVKPMTIWDLGVAIGRRWSVVMVGLVCTAVAVVLVGHHQGVYSSRTQVAFLAPSSSSYPNSLKTVSGDIIITAGVVAKSVNGTSLMPKMASPEVTLSGRGVTDGYSVLLPDTGGQWAPNFAQQVLDVQVVGPTADNVRRRQQALVDTIAEQLAALQNYAGVGTLNRITIKSIPSSPNVHYVAGQPIWAAAMTALLGGGLVVGLVGLLDVTARRREQRQSASDGGRYPPFDPPSPNEHGDSPPGSPVLAAVSSSHR
jgi:hypothetical protein